ncbi:Hypothetical predicted protein [Scomber scombrus]|uniref:Uncharacterized protein n=1 Tax=Scomber scombrus TaxID=13677 RepID=A0AAV1NZC6_SCOSC
MSRFSTRFRGGSPSGSLSGSRGVCSRAAAQNRGQSAADLTVLLPEVNQPRQMEYSFSRDLGLPGSNIVANRRPRQAGRQRSPQHRPLGQRETPSLWLPSPDKY